MSAAALPIARPAELPALATEHQWLVESLWAHQAVGIIGGEPKCCKSWLALSIAVAFATGRDCLGCYPVRQPGPVLLFAAEDALHIVRERLAALCTAQGLALGKLNLWVITAPSLRLDDANDRQRLTETVALVGPRLLILDPFVRLHRIDENQCAEVAPLLAFLRQLQREHGCAVALVHHARKGGASLRAGQALRGSSELHAWGDSNLYLRRHKSQLLLSVEHRAQPSTAAIGLALQSEAGGLHLSLAPQPSDAEDEPPTAPTGSSESDRILAAMASLGRPARLRELRAASRMRTESLGHALHELTRCGRVTRTEAGWALAANQAAGVSSAL
jgi:hypothetical protein